MKFERILKQLKSLNLTEYQALPFWSWNDKLEPKELIRQIRWMHEEGIGGFFMHARSGLKTEYMSPEWMNCVETCADEAERLGMFAWIYDENGFPSGFAGGKLLEKETNRDQHIEKSFGVYDKNATVSYLLNDEHLIRTTGGTCSGEYLNLYIRVAASTADILNPKVVDKFIALTHEQYKSHFKENFSKKIKGFFTDEPQYQRWGTPYTPMIANYFKEKYGEDILESLGLLFVEKDGYRKFRYRYWKGMQELMLRNFSEKIYNWCEDNDIKLTGHYIEETSLSYQMLCCAGIMPFYEFEHIPGIDWLASYTGNELPVKQVGSVAAQLGKKHILTETFACCGWNISPADLRRIAGFQYVNGVNLMCHHLIPYAEYGTRKHDYPAHYSRINPWVREEFKKFNDYFTRLGFMLAEGKEQINVAILHPIRSAYLEYKRDLFSEGAGIVKLQEQLDKTCRSLSSANIAYHFLDETLMERHGFVDGDQIGCGNCSYKYLVLPTLYTMGVKTRNFIHEYVLNGGKILISGDKPSYLEGDPYNYDWLESNCTLDEIIDVQPFRVENKETEIYATRRILDETTFLFALNNSEYHEYTQTFNMGDGIHSFFSLDLNTFEIRRVPLKLTLKPGEAIVLFEDSGEMCETEQLIPYDITFKNAEVDFEENYLPIDFVKFSEDGIHYSEKWSCAALFQKFLSDRKEGTIYLKYEFEVREKPDTVLLRAEDCNAEKVFLNGLPLKGAMPSKIEKKILEYDISSLIKIGINEYIIKMNWHEEESVYHALFGKNVTESLKNCIVYESELEPVYIAGKFGVYPTGEYFEDQDKRYTGAEEFYIGSIPHKVSEPIKEGFPFIAGPLTLKQKVNFTESNILLRIKGFYHLAKIKVNGNIVGNLMFDKEVDISSYVKSGENDIEVRFVLGNYNLMGPQHFKGSRSGFSSPYSFELNGTWHGCQSEHFHIWYDLRKLYEE